jgi:hypothetical protein
VTRETLTILDDALVEEKDPVEDILPAIEKETEHYCINCAHYIGSRWAHSLDDTSGNCVMRAVRFRREDSHCSRDIIKRERQAVTGLIVNTYKHLNATLVREDEDACGLEARWYEEYVPHTPYSAEYKRALDSKPGQSPLQKANMLSNKQIDAALNSGELPEDF